MLFRRKKCERDFRKINVISAKKKNATCTEKKATLHRKKCDLKNVIFRKKHDFLKNKNFQKKSLYLKKKT